MIGYTTVTQGYCEYSRSITKYTSESAALRNLGHPPAVIREDEAARRAAVRRAEWQVGFDWVCLQGKCLGRCGACDAPWFDTDKFLSNTRHEHEDGSTSFACCADRYRVECEICRAACLGKRRSYWQSALTELADGATHVGGLVCHNTANLGFLAVRPEHEEDYRLFCESAMQGRKVRYLAGPQSYYSADTRFRKDGKPREGSVTVLEKEPTTVTRGNGGEDEVRLPERAVDGQVEKQVRSTSKLVYQRKSVRDDFIAKRLVEEKKNLKKRLRARELAGKKSLHNNSYKRRNRFARQAAQRYVHSRLEELIQLEAHNRGWLQAVVVGRDNDVWGVFVPRVRRSVGTGSYVAPAMGQQAFRKRTGGLSEFDEAFNAAAAAGEPQPWHPYICNEKASKVKGRPRKARVVAGTFDMQGLTSTKDLEDAGIIQRVRPLLLSTLLKRCYARVRKADVVFRSVQVLEIGTKGGYHFHNLLVFPGGSVLSQVRRTFKDAWHSVSGNSYWGRKDSKKTWFEPIDSGGSAAAYVAKMAEYLTKQHLPKSRVRSSQFLYLSEAVRDKRLVEQGFLSEPEGGLRSCWKVNRQVKIGDQVRVVPFSYESPYDDAQLKMLSEFTHCFVNFEYPDLFAGAREFSYPVLRGLASVPLGTRSTTLAGSSFALAVDQDGNVLDQVPSGCYILPLRSVQKRIREFDFLAAWHAVTRRKEHKNLSDEESDRLLVEARRLEKKREREVRQFEEDMKSLDACITFFLDKRFVQYVNLRG